MIPGTGNWTKCFPDAVSAVATSSVLAASVARQSGTAFRGLEVKDMGSEEGLPGPGHWSDTTCVCALRFSVLSALFCEMCSLEPTMLMQLDVLFRTVPDTL